MTHKDPEFERLKDYDFADAKPASEFAHLAKLQLLRQHRLNVQIDADVATWLSGAVPPADYAKVMNEALREFKDKKAA